MNYRNLQNKHFCSLIATALVLTMSSCETRTQHNFKIYNFSEKSVVLESSNNHLSMYIPAQSEKTMEFISENENFDPSDLIIEDSDELSITFEDGKSFTYYKESQVIDSLGNIINLPKRIVNTDTTLFFPVSGLKNILLKNEWSKSCNDKKNKVCTYEFEISKEFYSFAKEVEEEEETEEEETEDEETGRESEILE